MREGNSDRRVATAVKEYARKHPHSIGKWSKDSTSHVTHMWGDFFGSEQSAVVTKAGSLRIELSDQDGKTRVLKESVTVAEGEVLAAQTMSIHALQAFYAKAIDEAKAEGILLSLHLKATMMKVSDPIMFGHAVPRITATSSTSTPPLSNRSASRRTTASGTSTPRSRAFLPSHTQRWENGLRRVYATRPPLAMVDSSKGITNLRAERRHHRRVDARGDPRFGSDVGTRREAARHPRR